jgi:hypothetical protein
LPSVVRATGFPSPEVRTGYLDPADVDLTTFEAFAFAQAGDGRLRLR